jgi:hypothetical protein
LIAVRGLATLCAVAACVAAIGACGGGKPAYCGDKTAFQDSIKDLQNIDVRSDGLGAVKSQLQKVQSAATTLVASAKKEYGDEANALKTSMASLGTAVDAAVASPSGQSVATVAAGLTGVQTAFKSLSDAVGSNC